MMEQFNFAYIHALSASCGFNIGTQTVDNDSIDMMIFTRMRRKAPSFRLGISGADCEAVLKNVKIQLISIQN